jgi:hypothetical protein
MSAAACLDSKAVRKNIFDVLKNRLLDDFVDQDEDDLVITCHTAVQPQDITFSKRRLRVKYVWMLDQNGNAPFRTDLVVDFSSFALLNELRINGGEPIQGLNPDHTRRMGTESEDLELNWIDEGRAMARDGWLVAVGALLGIAGAAFVEWVKSLLPHPKT